MAAGKGTRLNSKRPKVLHEVGGRALLLHVIACGRDARSRQRDLLHRRATRRSACRPRRPPPVSRSSRNRDQRGTGHAMQVLKAWLELSGAPLPKHLLVLSGDVPLIRPETLSALCELHLRERAAMTILTAVPPDPTGYGRVLRRHRGPARGHGHRRAEGAHARPSSPRPRSTPESTASRPRRSSASSTCSPPTTPTASST